MVRLTLEGHEWHALEEVSRLSNEPLGHVVRVAVRALILKCEKRIGRETE